ALPVPDLGLGCKRCGYPLAGLTEHRCPECGRPFTLEEYLPRGDWPALIAGGEEVRATVETIRLLHTYQIPFVEMADPLQAALAHVWPAVNRQAPRLGVPRERYFEAIDLIRRQRFGEAMPQPPAPPERAEEWRCAQCDEVNPPNFEICWNCGAAAPDGGG
ncbi:MAG: hypothetical protein ACODAQ_12100, partial [Phycisphaeraceae bacterium]